VSNYQSQQEIYLRGQYLEHLLRPPLRFRRPRHPAEPGLNILSIPHWHRRGFPAARLHHGREVNVERQAARLRGGGGVDGDFD
jgi:hypothetical protein